MFSLCEECEGLVAIKSHSMNPDSHRVLCGGTHCKNGGKKATEREPVVPKDPPPRATSIPLGIYEHYKGDRYVVSGFAVHHDTREPMVIYISLAKGYINVRPLYGSEKDPDGWLTPAPSGKERFRFLGTTMPETKPAQQRMAAPHDAVALYFGFGYGGGHHLSQPDTGGVPWSALPWKTGMIDAGLLSERGVPDRPDGRVHWTFATKDAACWHGFFWWDRSGDSRPNSNSGFYVRGFSLARDAFDFACAAWPKVVARQLHPLVLVDEHGKPL